MKSLHISEPSHVSTISHPHSSSSRKSSSNSSSDSLEEEDHEIELGTTSRNIVSSNEVFETYEERLGMEKSTNSMVIDKKKIRSTAI